MFTITAELPFPAAKSAEDYPYIWVHHEKEIPSPIFVVALTGVARWKTLKLPNSWHGVHWEEKLMEVRKLLANYLVGHRGSPFGNVVGFQWVVDCNENIFLTIDGDYVATNQSELIWPAVSLRIGK